MKRLVVLSADALVDADMGTLAKMPNFSRYMVNASGVKHLRSIYPTVTYPVHVSIATGMYPDRHGVQANEELHIGDMNPPWHWFHRAVAVDDLFTAAKRAGLKTAAVFWPVTGCHPDIDHLIDEYWPQSKEDTSLEAFRRSGSSEEILREVIAPRLNSFVPRAHPSADQFAIDCACDLIRRYRPHLIMIHPANVDGYRHQHGLFGPKIDQGIAETDRWLGDLIQATKDAGTYDETSFVLMSDHGQLEIKRVINLNVVLADHGLIDVDESGNIRDWRAYVKSTGMSAQVFLRDPNDRSTYSETYTLLKQMCDEGLYGFSELYTAEEIAGSERLSGGFSFVLETDGYTAFRDGWTRPMVRSYDLSDYRSSRATHGYLPDKGPQPVLYATGPVVRPGVLIDRRPIVDAAPTFARMLGIDLPGVDGQPIDEILS